MQRWHEHNSVTYGAGAAPGAEWLVDGAVTAAALDALTRSEQEVVFLWDAGLTYTAIAAEVDSPVEVVAVLLRRARERLVLAYALLKG